MLKSRTEGFFRKWRDKVFNIFKRYKRKKNCCVFMGGTSNHFPAMAAVVLELNEHLPDIDDIIIYLDRIDNKQIKILKSLSRVNIIEKKYNIFFGVKYDNGNIDHFSTMCFCKFEGFKLLNKYKKVIWTDYDVAIKEDINELVNDYNSGLYTLDTFDAKAVDNFRHPVTELNMEAKASYCALILFNDDISNYNNIYKDCYKYAKKYINDLSYGEQGIFNIVIDKHNIPIAYLNPLLYSCGIEESCIKYHNDAKIFHAYCLENKFWNGNHNDIYETFYAKWLAAGGAEFSNKRKLSKFTKYMRKHHLV